MISKRTIGAGLGALLALGGIVASSAPASAATASGCVNIATQQIGNFKDLAGDPMTKTTMHVSTTCPVYTWDITIEHHGCTGTDKIQVFIVIPHSTTSGYSEEYTGYHIVYLCGQTHILMTTLPVSTYFGIAIKQVGTGPNPQPCRSDLGAYACYVTMEW